MDVFYVSRCATGRSFYGNTVRRYVEFTSIDDDSYDIMQHFDEVYEVIEDAWRTNGRALIHCEMGVNRSGVLAVAYVMLHKNWGPITAAVYVKSKRKWLLVNEHFQRQLILFAQRRKMLHYDRDHIATVSKV